MDTQIKIPETEPKLVIVELKNSDCNIKMGSLTVNGIPLRINYISFIGSSVEESLPSSIYYQDGRKLWAFEEEKSNLPEEYKKFKVRALLVPDEVLKEYVLVLESWKKIIKVIPISDLLIRSQSIGLGGKVVFTGGRKMKEIIDIKSSLAKQLNMTPFFSETEQQLIEHLRRREAEKRQREEALIKSRQKEKQLNKDALRKERIRTILARQKINAIGPEGQKLRGFPVEEDEWRILPSGTLVILVYDRLGAMKIIEAFIVEKRRGKPPEKKRPKIALPEPPMCRELAVRSIGKLHFEFGDQLKEVLLFSRDDFDNLQWDSLSDDTMIAIGEQREKQFGVLVFRNRHFREIGYLEPWAEVYAWSG